MIPTDSRLVAARQADLIAGAERGRLARSFRRVGVRRAQRSAIWTDAIGHGLITMGERLVASVHADDRSHDRAA